MDDADYRSLLKIDKHALDDALIEQADIFFTISRDLSEAVSDRDQAKEELEIVDAQLYLNIRTEAADSGDKITETQVAAEVRVHPEHTGGVDNYLKARKRVDVLGALKDSFQQRSYMLRELVELFIAGYFMQSADKGHGGGKQETTYRANRERIKETFQDSKGARPHRQSRG